MSEQPHGPMIEQDADGHEAAGLSRKSLVRGGVAAMLGAAALAGVSRRAEAAPTPPDARSRTVDQDDPRVNRVIDVRAWGAVGDGTTDDTAAIQAALDAATEGETVVFPEGRYRVTATLTHAGSLGLVGMGQGLSWIDWAGPGDCLNLTFSSQQADRDYLVLRGLTINATRDDAGTAISAEWSEPWSGNWPHAAIEDVEVTRSEQFAWQGGLYLKGAWRSTVRTFSFLSSNWTGIGIELEGKCVDCNLLDVHLSNCDTPIMLGWATEGTVIINAVMVGPRHGVRNRVNPNNRKGPWFTLRDSHVNSLASAVELSGTGDSWICDNLFYKTPGSTDDYTAIKLINCRLTSVTGNEMYNVSAEPAINVGIAVEKGPEIRIEGNTTVSMNDRGTGIRVAGAPDCRVIGNHNRNVNTGIELTAGSDGCLVSLNSYRLSVPKFAPNPTPIIDGGEDTLLANNMDRRTG